MRLVTAVEGTREFLGGWIEGDRLTVDLARAAAAKRLDARPFASMLALIEAGDAARDVASGLLRDPPRESRLDSAACRFVAPLPRPVQLRDFLCFEQHLLNAFEAAKSLQIARAVDPEAVRRELERSAAFEVPEVWYQSPIYYNCNRLAVCGPDATVRWPGYSEVMDYELEFAAVIGRRGRDIPVASALDHVFGYTIFNDFSARDEQFRVMPGKLGPGKGKDFDDANALGPCIVTADEIGDPYALAMSARVNGVEWSRGSSASMHHRFEQVIAYLSRSETLHPGEVLGSGTVGSGCGLEQNRFLRHGDVVELEVERIGVLRNRVVRTD